MTKRSYFTKAIAAGAALLLLTSCASGAGDKEADAGSGERTLRLAHFMEPSHPHETCGMTELNTQLEGSGLKVETYPSSQLGGQTEALEQVYTGNLDMSINGSAFVGTYHEDFNVFGLGYLFKGPEEMMAFYETEKFTSVLEEVYESSGMRVFPGWYYGTRHVTSNRPVSTPADLKGLKLRVPDAPAFIETLKAMGATPTPMALDELYMGLQQRTVDAQENPTPVIDTMKLYEVQDNLTLTGHMVDGLHIVVAGKVWESLTEEQQAALSNAIAVAGDAAMECVIEQEDAYIEEFRAGDDIAVNEIDTTEFASLVQEHFSKGFPFSDLYTEILESQK
ncbi:DctP family TRAP transporter solute-binding subunit [Leucobacter albus]|uniref:DctP family TRAP transporter solute-binding subunit n=1 Tax=Leucobacter albus TaxID=272210 RepID=A0ABW3TNQ5_9MICO